MMMMIRFGSTQPPAHTEDVDEVISQNVVKPSHFDTAVCPGLNSVVAKTSRHTSEQFVQQCVKDILDVSFTCQL